MMREYLQVSTAGKYQGIDVLVSSVYIERLAADQHVLTLCISIGAFDGRRGNWGHGHDHEHFVLYSIPSI